RLIGKSRITHCSSDGAFRFTDLPPGVYAVTVRAEGFRDTRQEGVTVTLGGTAQVDVVLEPPVAVTQEAFVVQAKQPTIDTESVTLGTTVNHEFTSRIWTTRDYQGVA